MKGNWRWLLVAGLVFSLPAFSQLAPGLPREETLIVNQLTGRTGAPDNFNEWVGWKWRDRGMQQLMNEPLWSIDFASGEVINGLASAPPEYNDDFTQVTIHLREGVYWSDGIPITADDVVFTIELIKATPGMNYQAPMENNVERAYALDQHTVVIELKQPNSRFHTYFLDRWGCLWVMPKHVFEEVEDPLTFQFNPPVSSGPYVLHSYDSGGYWTVWERREDWDRTPTGILFGMPKPKYVVVRAYGDPASKVLGMLRHELDAADLTAEALKAALAQGRTIRAYQPSFPWVVNSDPCITGLTFNTAVPPYDNPEVRWALALSIDIVKYTSIAVDGMAPVSPLHIPYLPGYKALFFEPMEEWLEEFTLDLGNGETFKPYDPEVPLRLAELARSRGYAVPDDPEAIRAAFGPGWWKYAPDVAEKLLKKNGFYRDDQGRWHLPDGSLWRIRVLGRSDLSHLSTRNAVAAAQAWKEFGIEAEAVPSVDFSSLGLTGQFEVTTDWPAFEPWGAGADLYRTLSPFHSDNVAPIGETTPGHQSRWSSPELDRLIDQMEATDPTDEAATAALGVEALKVLIQNLPSIPTFNYIGFAAFDEYYWTNWPSLENPYAQPYVHWGPLKYMLPFLEPTGR
ncbi:TPA: peptide ABC transporter substrate-binding protein [Candidatus Acetothermia bacterium]|nr:peptide ABC transporter substrate-binding protein [Candidatus Acetothermia bacterium]